MTHLTSKFLKILFFYKALSCQFAFANAVGPATQNFNPTHDGGNFFTVESARMIGEGKLGLSVYVDQAKNVLPYYENSAGESRQFDDSLMGLTMNAGLGVLENLSVGFHLPMIVSQKVESEASRSDFETKGVMEFRLDVKYRIWGDENQGVGAMLGIAQNKIENNPFAGSGAGLSTLVQLFYDITFANVYSLALNVGLKQRNPGDQIENFPIEPLKDQTMYSFGFGYFLPTMSTRLILEYFASQPKEKTNAEIDKQNATAEMVLGAKISTSDTLQWSVGYGKGLGDGIFSPDSRLFVGATYSTGPLWDIKKEIQDKLEDKPEEEFEDSEPEFAYQPNEASSSPPIPKLADSQVTDKSSIDADPNADEVYSTTTIRFAPNSVEKAFEGSHNFLKQLSEHVTARNFESMTIIGHSDSQGSEKMNFDLAMRRAITIKTYLVKKFRLDGSKIKTESRGESEPIADNSTVEGRSKNRRAVFSIKYPK